MAKENSKLDVALEKTKKDLKEVSELMTDVNSKLLKMKSLFASMAD